MAGGGAAQRAEHRAARDRAIAARQVLFKYCRECHGGEATAGRLTVVDHNRLVDPGPVPVPFASRKKDSPRSQIVEFMTDGSMPPGGRDRPTPEEVKAVEEWLAAAAPGYPKAFDDATTLAHGEGLALHLNLTLDGSEIAEPRRAQGVIGRVPPFCFDAEEAAG